MLKLTKKADYGLMAMRHLAEHGRDGALSAKDVAEPTGFRRKCWPRSCSGWRRLACCTHSTARMAAILLARDPRTISAFEVIRAIDGPLFITSCVTVRAICDQSDRCNIREPLRGESKH